VKLLRATVLLLSSLAPWLAVAACSTMTAGIDVQYPAASAHPALLASVPPRRVQLLPVADRRVDQSRFGVRPGSGETLVTARPVADIVRDALAVELVQNGHTLVQDRADVVLAGTVDEFWLDVVEGRSLAQYIGRVAIGLAVQDGRTGATLAIRRYVGIKRAEGDPKTEAVWRDVMDAALVRAIHDVATDHELVSALGRTATAGRSGSSPWATAVGAAAPAGDCRCAPTSRAIITAM
jgi:hypothetical protein